MTDEPHPTKTTEGLMRQVDALVAQMPTVERTCPTCCYIDVREKPESEDEEWLAFCRAPLVLPVNASFHLYQDFQRRVCAVDVVRWQGKRMRPCPLWEAVF